MTILLWVDKDNRLTRLFIQGLNIDVIRSDLFDLINKNKESKNKLIERYRCEITMTLKLYEKKDHDYGSAWQKLSVEGIADLIYAKVVRMKSMLSSGRTPCDDSDGDGIGSTLRDLINYAVFALVLSADSNRPE